MVPMRARSVRRPSTGVRSIFQSPGVEDDALGGVDGDGEAVRHRVGDRDELDVERPDPAALAVEDGDQLGAVEQARLPRSGCGPARGSGSTRRSGSSGRAADRHRAPTWSSWPWVSTHASTRSAFSRSQLKSGQHQVDARHGQVGEHEPAVDDEDPPVDLEARAVAADLAEPAEEGEADRFSHP